VNYITASVVAGLVTAPVSEEYPREVAFIDDMPMSSTGKVIGRLLRERGKRSIYYERR